MAKTDKKETPPQYPPLHRSSTNKMLGGVCGGLGEYLNIDPTVVRILFAIMSFFGGSGFLVYIVLWLLLPSDQNPGVSPEENVKKSAEEIKNSAESFSHQIRSNFEGNIANAQPGRAIGIIVLVLGFLFLLNNTGIFDVINFGQLWPVLLIAVGFAIITRK